jgi:hypothetical protein
MVSYLMDTRKKVEDFIRFKGTVLQTETQYLGSKSMKIKHGTIKAILWDLEREGVIRIVKFSIGKSKLMQIQWVKKR